MEEAKEIGVVCNARRKTGEGRQTRADILGHAVQLASREGLEALTIGRLADALALSKSGLFAHFGSKEELQLATIEKASALFGERVLRVGRRFEPGLPRLLAMLEAWLAYLEARVFQGGCFFAAASAEFDGRPGRVRESIERRARSWLAALAAEARKAMARGQLARATDVEQLVFELHAVVHEANWALELLGDESALARSRTAVRTRLRAAATDAARPVLARLAASIVDDVRAVLGDEPAPAAAAAAPGR